MRSLLFAILVGVVATSCASGHSSETNHESAAVIVAPTSLAGLTSVVLRADSVVALGIEVASVETAVAALGITVGGEVMVPAGRDVVLASPSSGRISTETLPRPGDRVRAGQSLFAFIPTASVDRDVRARAVRDLETARADLALARTRLARAQTMAADRSGSQRALDEARAQEQTATASVGAAEARVRTIAGGSLDSDVVLSMRSPVDGIVRAVRVTAGQSVPSGVSLIDIAGTGRWVRATMTARDAQRAGASTGAYAQRLGSEERIALIAVTSPPSADALRGTVDRFFALPESADWTPGERVLVELVATTPESRVAVPFASVLRDAEGGAWVYEQLTPLSFRRRRIEPIRREGDRVLIADGLAVGARIVSAGAAELWGFELGADR